MYYSDRELRDHMSRAHRKFIPEPSQAPGSGNTPVNVAAIQNLKQNTVLTDR
jgi:hypothetical protein